MGADIHSWAEVKGANGWDKIEDQFFGYADYMTTEPFGWQSYAMFGFLADVRNYSHCTPLAQPKGLPHDSNYLNESSEYDGYPHTRKNDYEGYTSDYHSHSWFTLKELLDFDYDQTFWDRRVTKQTGSNLWDGAALAEEGEGQTTTYREHLGTGFFNDIEVLKTLGKPEDVRVVFMFDN